MYQNSGKQHRCPLHLCSRGPWTLNSIAGGSLQLGWITSWLLWKATHKKTRPTKRKASLESWLKRYITRRFSCPPQPFQQLSGFQHHWRRKPNQEEQQPQKPLLKCVSRLLESTALRNYLRFHATSYVEVHWKASVSKTYKLCLVKTSTTQPEISDRLSIRHPW